MVSSSPGAPSVDYPAVLSVTSILHGDERKQLARVVVFAMMIMAYLLATILLPTFLSKPLKSSFGLVPTANLMFVAPMWILGICLWRMAGDSRSATLFALGWWISAFASFALGWSAMQSGATVVSGISVTDWDQNDVADGYYFTDGYVGTEFQVTDYQPKCAAGTQRCSEYAWSLAPVFASAKCALLNSTKQVVHRVVNQSTQELISAVNVTVPALNASMIAACNVLFVVMQVEPAKVGIIGSITRSTAQGTPNPTVWWSDTERMCGDSGNGGLCTRLSPYSPHACLPTIGTSAMPDPTLLGCAPINTCETLMRQSFLPQSADVCHKRYFAIGNLQQAADDGRAIAIIMFCLTGVLFVLSVINKCRKDVGFTNGVRTMKALAGLKLESRQAADLGV